MQLFENTEKLPQKKEHKRFVVKKRTLIWLYEYPNFYISALRFVRVFVRENTLIF